MAGEAAHMKLVDERVGQCRQGRAVLAPVEAAAEEEAAAIGAVPAQEGEVEAYWAMQGFSMETCMARIPVFLPISRRPGGRCYFCSTPTVQSICLTMRSSSKRIVIVRSNVTPGL